LSQELEIAAEDAVGAEVAEDGATTHAHAHAGACANCGATLQGAYCHICGQNADDHKRSILHLAWEGVEGLLHLDGRLRRTAPDLFLHPGRLARDYMDGRIARHVPPFRTFLVALLIFIFAAEHATHELQAAQDAQTKARAAQLATPQGRARVAAATRAEAVKDRADDLADAAKDRDEDLKDPDENHAKVLARYADEADRVNQRYTAATAKADRIAQGLPAGPPTVTSTLAIEQNGKVHRLCWFKDGLQRAIANPEYYLTVMFAWGHRLAVLLLPILGLSLALVYRRRREIFLYDHLLVAMNLLSFAFLANAAALLMPPSLVWWALLAVALWTPINLFQTLRGAYGSSLIGAVLKTLVVWAISVFSFFVLMTAVMLVALAQI
jgi:HPt (histidine-containing phosphotransfer) domain-containing protein